jgi:hypothetical protein
VELKGKDKAIFKLLNLEYHLWTYKQK